MSGQWVEPFRDYACGACGMSHRIGEQCPHLTPYSVAPTRPNPAAMGWECPRCRAIHAPHVHGCDCPAPTQTFASTTIAAGADPGSVVLGPRVADEWAALPPYDPAGPCCYCAMGEALTLPCPCACHDDPTKRRTTCETSPFEQPPPDEDES